jgi:hypothetical protein
MMVHLYYKSLWGVAGSTDLLVIFLTGRIEKNAMTYLMKFSVQLDGTRACNNIASAVI